MLQSQNNLEIAEKLALEQLESAYSEMVKKYRKQIQSNSVECKEINGHYANIKAQLRNNQYISKQYRAAQQYYHDLNEQYSNQSEIDHC